MKISIIVLVGLQLFTISSSIQARDVTGLETQHTSLDEIISSACNTHCEGNRRGGYYPSGQYINRVLFYADLVNKHNTGTILTHRGQVCDG